MCRIGDCCPLPVNQAVHRGEPRVGIVLLDEVRDMGHGDGGLDARGTSRVRHELPVLRVRLVHQLAHRVLEGYCFRRKQGTDAGVRGGSEHRTVGKQHTHHWPRIVHKRVLERGLLLVVLDVDVAASRV